MKTDFIKVVLINALIKILLLFLFYDFKNDEQNENIRLIETVIKKNNA